MRPPPLDRLHPIRNLLARPQVTVVQVYDDRTSLRCKRTRWALLAFGEQCRPRDRQHARMVAFIDPDGVQRRAESAC